MNSSFAELEYVLKMLLKLFLVKALGKSLKGTTSLLVNYWFYLNRNCKTVSGRKKPTRTDVGDPPEQDPAPAVGGRAIQRTESRSDSLAADAEIKDSRETPRQTSN